MEDVAVFGYLHGSAMARLPVVNFNRVRASHEILDLRFEVLDWGSGSKTLYMNGFEAQGAKSEFARSAPYNIKQQIYAVASSQTRFVLLT
jgi:hypothetical protein